MLEKLKQRTLISIAFAGILYLAITIYIDFDLLLLSFAKFNLLLIPILLLLSLGNYFARYFKWNYYLSELKIKLDKKDSLLIFMSGLLMSVTPGKIGELLKAYLVKTVNKTPVSVTAPIIFAERATDFLSLTILALIGAYIYDYGRDAALIITIIIFIGILILTNRKLFDSIMSVLSKIKLVEKRIESIERLYHSTYTLLKIKPLIIAVMISVVSWGFECFGYYLVINNFNAAIDVSWSFFSYSFSTIVGAVSMLPGGLGVTEGSFLLMLTSKGLTANDAAATTFITRVATLWFAVLVGVVAVIFFQRKFGKINFNNE
ncbi:MAG: TIGR00374 family protein [Ignavibacterium sp.]|uniref:lysylphosphatidylglycerol synthase transmembrane domain-containing protein n=1 Tax=Ignavibacterium sp. TaxID=2651167 RepID=UPI0021DED83A|nr:lysylphosphatidylglycerol synthase transmembrane domain-containing protein [Ignavibacterium sp.]BDQ02036.1 MAG: TIGR00374 family protein [Ignavibacterium sp.]GIV45232.1 MAG: TIGR00374 family protein [Ignavibacterium sp.]